ncbi:hypothetical protein [Rhizobium rhizogenes]|uniref:hypothetical protein n=1 Tax=Rhizobium rhizogenes TaxID=359 RepID=UPI0016505A3F
MSSIGEITVTFGVRWWVKAAVFVGWLVWYSLPVASWRNRFADWFATIVSKRGVLVR